MVGGGNLGCGLRDSKEAGVCGSGSAPPTAERFPATGKKNAGMSRRFPWYWSRSLLDQEILDLLALLGQRGHPARLLAAAGPGFLGIGRVAVFRRDLAQLAALFRRLARPFPRLRGPAPPTRRAGCTS